MCRQCELALLKRVGEENDVRDLVRHFKQVMIPMMVQTHRNHVAKHGPVPWCTIAEAACAEPILSRRIHVPWCGST